MVNGESSNVKSVSPVSDAVSPGLENVVPVLSFGVPSVVTISKAPRVLVVGSKSKYPLPVPPSVKMVSCNVYVVIVALAGLEKVVVKAHKPATNKVLAASELNEIFLIVMLAILPCGSKPHVRLNL